MEKRIREISCNLSNIKNRIDKACSKTSRDPKEVKIIAVSKCFPTSDILIANSLSLNDFGENRVQEMIEKFNEIGTKVIWHQIGHLQTNKVRQIIDKVHLIHSVSSDNLLTVINKEAGKISRVANILLQVNTSGEISKFGIKEKDIDYFLSKIERMKNIKLKGLMTIAPHYKNPEDTRTVFRDLKKLFDSIKCYKIKNVEMTELSMGMSNDYDIAIQEGSTMIRVGTSLFDQRQYNISGTMLMGLIYRFRLLPKEKDPKRSNNPKIPARFFKGCRSKEIRIG
ncbi:YggS family pyridoxal phosphate-dependent enzyme [Pseudomonadota bacterium]